MWYLLNSRLVTADHPFFTTVGFDDLIPGSKVEVDLGDIVFSQDSVGKLIGGAWDEYGVYNTVQELLQMSLENRKAHFRERFDQMRVVPIRRHGDASMDVTNRRLVSLDNRQLLIMRATLYAHEKVTIRVEDPEKELDKKWTAKDEGFTIKARRKGEPIPLSHDELSSIPVRTSCAYQWRPPRPRNFIREEKYEQTENSLNTENVDAPAGPAV